MNARCEPEGQDPGDVRGRGLGCGACGCGVPRPCSVAKRRGAWRCLSGRWLWVDGGDGREACRAAQCACVPHLEASHLGRRSWGDWVVGSAGCCAVAGLRLGPQSGGGGEELTSSSLLSPLNPYPFLCTPSLVPGPWSWFTAFGFLCSSCSMWTCGQCSLTNSR